MEELRQAVKTAAKKLYDADIEPELSRPAEQFGDYATNAALQLAKKSAKSPQEIARSLAEELKNQPGIGSVKIAGPGFINFKLTDEALAKAAFSATDLPKPLNKQDVVAEYSDPNPFKVLHVGHLYTSVVGDAIANLLETAGANVHRVNFGGDVGLHVAKTMWAIIKTLGSESVDELLKVQDDNFVEWMTKAYVEGNHAYDEDGTAKQEIIELNIRIYKIHEQDDHSSPLAQLYWACRKWNYDVYFKTFYDSIGTHFEKYYPESETVAPGIKAVKENVGKVFQESDGAIIFKGETHNLHTRVFINKQGLPTYETKDVGLILKKWEDYHFDRSIVITGNEIYEYMQVVLKAVEQFAPKLVQKTTHITHGLVKLAGGEKMSSRKGNILKATDVINMVEQASGRINQNKDMDITLGAIRYAFTKNRIGADFIFAPDESVSLEGNSGPYLQYAHARACSILAKAAASKEIKIEGFDESERSLARKISEYPEVVEKAVDELMPHYVCTYLYELAQCFNGFYEKSRIIGDQREAVRLALVRAYKDVLASGLAILNITAPEKM